MLKVNTGSKIKPSAPKDKSGVPTTLNLDADIRAELERVAEEQDRSMSWIANRLLRERLMGGP